jgi:hypothetical protein
MNARQEIRSKISVICGSFLRTKDCLVTSEIDKRNTEADAADISERKIHNCLRRIE